MRFSELLLYQFCTSKEEDRVCRCTGCELKGAVFCYRRFKADVLLDSSSVKLADSVDRSDADVIDVVQLTAILDETFTENLQQHPDIR